MAEQSAYQATPLARPATNTRGGHWTRIDRTTMGGRSSQWTTDGSPTATATSRRRRRRLVPRVTCAFLLLLACSLWSPLSCSGVGPTLVLPLVSFINSAFPYAQAATSLALHQFNNRSAIVDLTVDSPAWGLPAQIVLTRLDQNDWGGVTYNVGVPYAAAQVVTIQPRPIVVLGPANGAASPAVSGVLSPLNITNIAIQPPVSVVRTGANALPFQVTADCLPSLQGQPQPARECPVSPCFCVDGP